MESPAHSIEEKDIERAQAEGIEDPDAVFGGSAERRKLERKLLWKLDCRMAVMVVIYILNYVS